MNKRLLRKAATLWGLALIVHTDNGADSDEANELREIARQVADDRLSVLGYDAADLLCEADCIKAVAP